MTQSTQPLPILGGDNATEDPKIRSLLSELQGIINGNIDSSNIAVSAWQNLTLGTNVGSFGLTPAVRLEAGGVVRVRGTLLMTGAVGGGATLGTIPLALRPPYAVTFPVDASGTERQMSITSAGLISISPAMVASNYVSLEGITYTTS